VDKSKITKEEADAAMQSVQDLIDDPQYKPFFFKSLYRIGVEAFFMAAAEARKADHPGRKFASLLKYGKRVF
jgi:hypothetical protein